MGPKSSGEMSANLPYLQPGGDPWALLNRKWTSAEAAAVRTEIAQYLKSA